MHSTPDLHFMVRHITQAYDLCVNSFFNVHTVNKDLHLL